ncbi:MAG: DsbA family protein [Hyphomicrobiaceae bacterium]
MIGRQNWEMVAAVALSMASLAACSNGSSISNSSALLGAISSQSDTASAQEKFDPFRDENIRDYGRREVIENPTLAQVMEPGPLPERSIGRADAPVTMIKYASMTCPYCRQFQVETFPVIKQKYIDTGKLRFILREFPIGYQSGAATIALRCAEPEKYFALYDKLMRQQRTWVSQAVRRDPIFRVAKQVGMTRGQFDACFADKTLAEQLNTTKERGRKLGVIGTPNFFVNGRLIKRRLTTSDIHKLISKELEKPVSSVKNG